MYQRKLNFQEAVERALKQNYCNFKGRASRSEFWWFVLFTFLCSVVVSFVAIFSSTVGNILNVVVSLGFFLPSLGLSVRRLHDVDKSGWWVLLSFIPVVGFIVLLIWFVRESQNSPNEYGVVPNLEA